MVSFLAVRRSTRDTTIRSAVVVPFVLAAAGVCVPAGCVPVPGDHRATDRPQRPETLVGPARSDRPLRLSESTLPHVIAWLGSPPYATVGWRAVVYRYEIRTGVLLAVYEPPRDILASRYFVVRFAPSGTIESYRVYKRRGHIPEHRRGELHVARQIPSPPAPRGSAPDPP